MTDDISVEKLHRTYGDGDAAVHALRGVSLQVGRGEVVALTGPSGSGKTTLLNCLLGLDRADEGTIEVFGRSIDQLSYEQAVDWRRETVAIVFQATGLLGHLTAYENVDLVLRMRHVPRSERADRIGYAFDRFGISSHRDHRPTELSGGQRQRVALARALATQPRLLIADEPTGELDTDTTAMVLQELRDVSELSGTTMILATHDRDVEAIVDRTLHMVDGRIAP